MSRLWQCLEGEKLCLGQISASVLNVGCQSTIEADSEGRYTSTNWEENI